MTSLNAQLVTIFVATTGVGFLMMMAGLQKSALERRRRRRNCPSCGRHIEGRVCGTCSAS
jgi:uncharacterized protein (TIGR03382 family)